MAMIYVRTRPGRRAVDSDGREIGHDKFVPYPDSPYIRRLVEHWGDLEAQDKPEAKRTPTPPVQGQTGGAPTAPAPKPAATAATPPAPVLNPATPKP